MAFLLKTPIIIYQKGLLGVLSRLIALLLLGEVQEVNVSFLAPRAQKVVKMALLG